MANTFAFNFADAQLSSLKNRRNDVSATWAEKLRLVISRHLKACQATFHTQESGFEWAYYDEGGTLLMGRVNKELAPAGCYLSALSNADLLKLQHQPRTMMVKQLGTGVVPEAILRQLIA